MRDRMGIGRPERDDRSRRRSRGGSGSPSYISPYARGGGSRLTGSLPATSRSAARSLGPRHAIDTLGRPRRSAWPRVLVATLAVAAVTGAVAWWLLSRPAAVVLAAVPSDARITLTGAKSRDGSFGGSRTTTGALTAEELEPGTYRISVERAGFKTHSTRVTLGRGERLSRSVALEALPFAMTFSTRPSGATVTVTRKGSAPVKGVTPCTLTVLAGEVSVAVERSGCNRFERAMFVDAAQSYELLLDPRGQIVHALGSIATKGAPKGVALTPDGREAWSAILNGPPSIQIFDPMTGRLTGSIDLGAAGAVEVIFDRAGTRAYASQMETKLHETSKVFEIDVKTRAVLRTLDTASTMTKVIALSPDEKTLYTANWAGNDVSVIDLGTGVVRERIPVARTPRGLWPTSDGRYLYVAGFGNGDLERVDVKTGVVTRLFSSGGAMRHLVADERAGKLYASDMGKNTIWVLDLKTDKVSKFATTDHKPNTIDLSPDGRILFVSNRGANNPKSYYLPGYEWGSVLLFDTATGKPLDAIVGGNQCTALDVSGSGRLLVFSDFLDNRLRVYEVPTFSTLVKGNGGRFAAHFAALKKKTPGTAASAGASGD